MMRFLAFALLATLPALSQSPAVQASAGADFSAERLKNIPSRLQELVARQTIPGAVALVARHGRIGLLEAAGWQDVEGHKPMTTGSIFQVMSMTKNFTGVAAMMLVEEGKLELRRPVEDYLPEFKDQLVEEKLPDGRKMTHPPAHPVTVWQLMSHTSGLPGDPDGELEDNPRTMRVPLAEAVRFYGRSHLEFEPGSRWRYSNEGIATLGRIVEVLSGEEYTHFVESRILSPLGMKSSFFFPPQGMKDRIALVYRHANGKLVRSGAEILGGDPVKYRAGARYPAPEFGLYSTAEDLFRFYQMLLNGGVLDGREYLTRQSIKTMTRVFTPDVSPSGWLGGTGYGLTFEIVDKPEGTLLLHSPGTFGHGGAFGTEGWIDPANDLIRILLVQVSDGTAGAARAAVMQIGEAAVAR
jgi:CubicO group peptidase (beta-lactamase class C family)